MNKLAGVPRVGSRLDIQISAEIAAAMRKFGATPDELNSADAQHPAAAYDTLEFLGARSDLLRVIGSLGDTMGSEQVLDQLHRWNMEEP